VTLKVDEFGKVTVSLGGVCKLWCKHCYITARQFQHPTQRSVESVVAELREQEESFSVVCISGDTDCFLNEATGVELIERVCSSFPVVDVMFTSRLVPSGSAAERISELARDMARDSRLLVPCVSVVTWTYPNKVENPRFVPPTAERIAFMRHLADQGIPCFLAIRPTFPFTVVSRDEIQKIFAECGDAPACVLGEAFILDTGNTIATRLDITRVDEAAVLNPLSFLDQPGLWEKRIYTEEVEFARKCSHEAGIPYFLRSMSAMKYLREYWDLDRGRSKWRIGLPLDITIEEALP
jgi:hypothetical protein